VTETNSKWKHSLCLEFTYASNSARPPLALDPGAQTSSNRSPRACCQQDNAHIVHKEASCVLRRRALLCSVCGGGGQESHGHGGQLPDGVEALALMAVRDNLAMEQQRRKRGVSERESR
jgi:hypothetical protein